MSHITNAIEILTMKMNDSAPKDKIVIFDTTLRDGEQSPGASMTLEEKVRIAKMLEMMKVDVIEAGFASASPGDFASVSAVAQAVKDSRVCSLARAIESDIIRAGEALKMANLSRIHTFIATSPIHMKYKLMMEPEEVLAQAIKAVKCARNIVEDVEFSLEDGGRSDFDFMCRIIEATISAGASTINIPDTVGYTTPEEYGAMIGRVINTVSNADQAIFSVHCHNDLGLAVANSLSAVVHGARQVECTINGLGERAGNASLEEVVMAINTRKDYYPVTSNINTQQIVPTSKLVSAVTGFPVQPNKAIVGANAFAHEAGIHQDGVLKHRETYEIMKAEDVGWHNNKLVLGKHSGRAAVKARLQQLGIDASDMESFKDIFVRFKELADKKHEVFDEDLQMLAGVQRSKEDDMYQLVDMSVAHSMGSAPRANISLSVSGQSVETESTGDGLVDAAFKAIERVANSNTELLLYSVNAITKGTESQGEVTVRLSKNDRIVNGVGADTDIVIASVKSYLNALNLLQTESAIHPQQQAI